MRIPVRMTDLVLGECRAGRSPLFDHTMSPLQGVLWLSVRPFGNVRGNPFQKEFPDQIRNSIRTGAGQTIKDD